MANLQPNTNDSIVMFLIINECHFLPMRLTLSHVEAILDFHQSITNYFDVLYNELEGLMS